MTTEVIDTLQFSSELQSRFAALSGDWNPMHMSSLAARRTQAGRPIVHGIHTVLCSLDGLVKLSPTLPLPSKLMVKFLKPMYVEDSTTIVKTENAHAQLQIQARIDGTATTDMRLTLGDYGGLRPTSSLFGGSDDPTCRDLSVGELAGRSGTVWPTTTPEQIMTAFPHAAGWLGVEQVAALLCLSQLVGMECPGLHSLLSGFAIEFSAEPSPPSLQYLVASIDQRFRLLKMDVAGLGIRGRVEAFARHPPVPQVGMEEVSSVVDRNEFAGQHALVVGGSRGLGEVTAKLLAAGGAHPIITYAVGKEDAERIVDEIKRWGGDCDSMEYDVRAPPSIQLESLTTPVPYFYYYATPQIFRRRTKRFDSAILDDFLAFYVRGFYDLCLALRTSFEQGCSAFYPSSVALEERPRDMTEYAMAKAAAEILCSDLVRGWSGMHIHLARLPRLLTDQTATLAPTVDPPNPVEVLLPVVRAVQAIRPDHEVPRNSFSQIQRRSR